MKKSFKALIFCVLTAFVMFAAVYASPIVAKAATQTNSETLLDESTLVPCGSVTVIYDDSEINFIGYTMDPIVGYWMDSSDVAMMVVVDATPVNNVEVIKANYYFNFAGSTYSGTVDLVYDGYANYFMLGVVGNGSNTGYDEAINDLKDLIGNISNDPSLTGEDRVIEFAEGDSLPGDVIAAMANSKNVTLKFTFVYKGYEFCTTITSEAAKTVYNPEVDWAGPCYLADNFPTVWTGKVA